MFVYIAEAHAVDEWPIRSSRYNKEETVSVTQTRTTEERVVQARAFYHRFEYDQLVCF